MTCAEKLRRIFLDARDTRSVVESCLASKDLVGGLAAARAALEEIERHARELLEEDGVGRVNEAGGDESLTWVCPVCAAATVVDGGECQINGSRYHAVECFGCGRAHLFPVEAWPPSAEDIAAASGFACPP